MLVMQSYKVNLSSEQIDFCLDLIILTGVDNVESVIRMTKHFFR